jgi:hypothetical protein
MDELDASWLPMVKSWRLNEVRFIRSDVSCVLVCFALCNLIGQFICDCLLFFSANRVI